jgi:hypothetical protein
LPGRASVAGFEDDRRTTRAPTFEIQAAPPDVDALSKISACSRYRG